MKYKKYKNVFVILLFIIIMYFSYILCKSKEHFENKIPLNLFNTWETHELLPKMKENVEKLKERNPEFNYYLYDDNECREFIKNNFDESVVNAYDSLIPGAYRADLWRYCILYIYGGVYLDIKFCTINDFKLINLTDKEYFVRDIEKSGHGIYQAFIVAMPGNKKLYNTIQKIVENVKNKFYGHSCFSPTGPLLLIQEFTEEELNNFSPIGLCENECPTKTCICMNGKPIMAIYKEYYDEIHKYYSTKKIKRYYEYWDEKNMYK